MRISDWSSDVCSSDLSRPNDRAVFQQRLPDILIIHHIERMAGGRCLIRPHFEPSDPRRVRRYATMLERDLLTVTGDNVADGLKGRPIGDGMILGTQGRLT